MGSCKPPSGHEDLNSGLTRRWLTMAGDLALPPLCLNCRSRILQHQLLCASCWSSLRFITPPLCDRLGAPLPFDAGGRQISPAALARPPRYGRARAVARHEGAMKQLIHGFKYHRDHSALPLFARWMNFAGLELIAEADLILPVPLHYWRLWRRRFNQAALLAKALGELTGLPDDPFSLRRVRSTRSQVGLTLQQRRRNVASAFRVPDRRRARIADRRILLVDDVITTGATIEACAATLRRAGAKQVDVLALSRAGPY